MGLGLGGGGNAGCLSADEEVVCISENDACGVDAIQVILGCSIGKGNLLFHMRGKQAFTFFDRKSGKSLRLVLKPKPEGMTRQESFAYYQSCAPKDMFQVTEAKIQLPEKARIFDSYVCDCCGESTGANWIRLAGEKKLCLDCYETYNRFDVYSSKRICIAPAAAQIAPITSVVMFLLSAKYGDCFFSPGHI